MSLGVGSFAASGSGVVLLPTLAFGGSNYIADSSLTFTTTIANLGTDGPTRRVHLTMNWRPTLTPTVTIGGVTATLGGYQQGFSSSTRLGVFTAIVPTGTSATVSVSFSGTGASNHILAWWVSRDLLSSTPTDFGGGEASKTISTSLNVLGGGFVLAHGIMNYGASAGSVSWSGVTQNFASNYATQSRHSGASRSSASANPALSVSAAFNYDTSLMFAASFR